MKIIDCFTFYNELDLLSYRFHILYPIVDYFVIVEATRTFAGNNKKLYYEENKQLFEKYQDKIIHIIDDGLLENIDAWTNEYHQRNSIDNGLKKIELEDDDKIMVSDVDEIPDPSQIIRIKSENISFDKYKFEQDFYYYNLKCKHQDKWCLSEIISYQHYKDVYKNTPQECRKHDFDKLLSPGGWHLSYFGDSEWIRNKIEQFSHQEYNQEFIKNQRAIENNIINCKDIYSRNDVQLINIPISENNYLPPEYEKLGGHSPPYPHP